MRKLLALRRLSTLGVLGLLALAAGPAPSLALNVAEPSGTSNEITPEPSPSSGEMPPSGDELLQILSQKDGEALAGLTMTVTVDAAASPVSIDPSDIRYVMNLTSDGTSRALESQAAYLAPPLYVPLGEGGTREVDYDEDGNLILWRAGEKHGLSAPDLDDSYEQSRLFLAAPSGISFEEEGPGHLLRHPLGSGDGTRELERALMALGRGYSGQLSAITIVADTGDGLLVAQGPGTASELGLTGVWTLSIDTPSGYLVRDALFLADGESDPALTATSGGVVAAGSLTLGASGSLYLSLAPGIGDSEGFTLDSLSSSPDPLLISRARSVVTGSLPIGTAVTDLTVSSPTYTFVGEVVPVETETCCDCERVNREQGECLHFVGFENLGCFSNACIANWMITATCAQDEEEPPPNCRIRQITRWEVLQTVYRLPANRPCPNAAANVNYNDWITLADRCRADCTPIPRPPYRTACEVDINANCRRHGRLRRQARRGRARQCF